MEIWHFVVCTMVGGRTAAMKKAYHRLLSPKSPPMSGETNRRGQEAPEVQRRRLLLRVIPEPGAALKVVILNI